MSDEPMIEVSSDVESMDEFLDGMPEEDYLWGEFYHAAVPAGAIFRMDVKGLRQIMKTQAGDELSESGFLYSYKRAEVCFIALIAYFEAFCKTHFASLINMVPELLEGLKAKGYDLSVDASDILLFDADVKHRLGFLIAEKQNFGTAREVNARYRDLLLITPFSESEKTRFDLLLNDRNLLVHHGGIYTLSYARERFGPTESRDNAFFNSLLIEDDFFFSAAKFLESIAFKTVRATQKKLIEFVENKGLDISRPAMRAVDFLDLSLP
jgi:hypothetical protein